MKLRNPVGNPPPRFLLVGAFARSLVIFRGPLLEGVIAHGWDAHAAASAIEEDAETEDALRQMGVSAHSVPIERASMNLLDDLRTLFSMVRLMLRTRPDAMLAYTIKPVVWGTLAGWLARVPRRYAMVTGLGYAFTGSATGKRRLAQAIARQLYRLALSRAHGVFFQNPDDAALFRQLRLVPASMPVTIVNGSGVDLRHYLRKPLPPEPLRFLLIARLLGDKGIREYAAAAAIIRTSHPEVQFHLVGGTDPNPDAIRLEELQDWQNNGAIIWHGAQSDVRPFLANSHVYVLPSYREGTPRTVLEAMATGRPIITTDTPGCRETVTRGLNGLLVPPCCVEALVEAMRHFINCPEQIYKMGEQSFAIVQMRFAANRVADAMLLAMGVLATDTRDEATR